MPNGQPQGQVPGVVESRYGSVMADRNELIADVLMAAAYADEHLDGRERDAVSELLARAMGADGLPVSLQQRLLQFERQSFDLQATAEALDLEGHDDVRHLLELVVAVHEADEIWDLAEDAYLRSLAEALGAPAELYEDLTIGELVLEHAGEVLAPPPMPEVPNPPPLPE